MGDVGDYWREHKDYKKAKADNAMAHLDQLTRRLHEAGLTVRMLNSDHYRVTKDDRVADWWPTTGRWWSIQPTAASPGFGQGHGIGSLIAWFKKKARK